MPFRHLTPGPARGIDRIGEPRRRCVALQAPRKQPALLFPSLPELIRARAASFRHVAETLAFAALGGLTFGLLGMPAGYLSGSILVVACAALAGRPMFIPVPLMRVLLVLIGISLGAVVTPETLHGMATYPLSIGVLIVATSVISLCGMIYLRRVQGWDKITAYLAAVPGGLSQVMALAVELNADVRAIAIVQTIRVVIIAVGFPALLALLGLVSPVHRSMGGSFEWAQADELALLVIVSTAMAIVAYRLRFPGGLLFGAMLTSGVLHGSGYIHVVMPWWVSYTVMIAFGAVSGSRFANTPARLLLNYFGAAFGTFATAVSVAAIFTLVLTQYLTVPPAEIMIAYAPGAVDAMMLLALALNLDPVYVGAHHLTRILFVLLSLPLVVRKHGRAGKSAGELERARKRSKPEQPFDD